MQVLRLHPRPAASETLGGALQGLGSAVHSFRHGICKWFFRDWMCIPTLAPPLCTHWYIPGFPEAIAQAFRSNEPCHWLSCWVKMQKDRRLVIRYFSLSPVLEFTYWGASQKFTCGYQDIENAEGTQLSHMFVRHEFCRLPSILLQQVRVKCLLGEFLVLPLAGR